MKSIVLVILFSILFSSSSLSQSLGDMTLLKNTEFEKREYREREVGYGFKEGKKTLNPFYHILSSSMYLYQKFISPQLSRGCAFNPSCSQYSKDLIEEYGVIKGSILSSDRITRCTRVSLSDKSHYHFDTKDGKMHETVDRYKLGKYNKNSNSCNH